MSQKVIIRFLVGIWVLICILKPTHHLLQTFRPKAYARGVCVNPPLSLICYKNFITCAKDITVFIRI